MKLYIPTSSRNFNCIFSEESISPRAFYKARGFGYSNWHEIPENPCDNCIILYEDLASFSRPDNGYDDYPLLIEVDLTNELLSKMYHNQAKRVYVYDGVIYFSPKTTRFIFFEQKHYDIARLKSESSLETKLVDVYYNRIEVLKCSGNYEFPGVDEPALNENELKLAQRINKLKGFAYGYYTGSLLSISKEKNARAQRYQKILNVAAAIASSLDKRPTPRQEEDLRALCLTSPIIPELVKQFRMDERQAALIVAFLAQKEYINDESTRKAYNLYYSILNPEGQEKAISWLTEQIESNLSSGIGEWRIDPAEKQIEILPDASVELNRYKAPNKAEQYNLLHYWVNNIFTDMKYAGSLSSYRNILADDLTISARDHVYGEKWTESMTKSYMNAVRRNLQGESFVEKWSDGVLCSVAAVLMKGDSWEGLRKFMMSQNLTDYSWAFAIFGMLNGYASLPRDFANILLEYNDPSYSWRIYDAVDFMVASIVNSVKASTDDIGDIPEEFMEDSGKSSFDWRHPISSAISSVANILKPDEAVKEEVAPKVEQVLSEETKILEQQKPDLKEENAIEREPAKEVGKYSYLYPGLVEEMEKHFSEKDEKKKAVIMAYFSNEVKSLTDSAISIVGIINGLEEIKPCPDSKKNNWKGTVKGKLVSYLKQRQTLDSIQQTKETDLFSQRENERDSTEHSSGITRAAANLFLSDSEYAWRVIDSYLTKAGVDTWVKDKLIRLHFDLFRYEYQETYTHPMSKELRNGKYYGYPTDNDSVLENFRETLYYRKRDKANEYKRVNVDSLIWQLRQYYK